MKIAVRILGLANRIAEAQVARIAEQAARCSPAATATTPPPINQPPR